MTDLYDWVAAHDQSRAEVIEVLDNRRPFFILWVVEGEDGEPDHVASTGLCRPQDMTFFLAALAQRLTSGDGYVGAGHRPGDTE